MLAEIGEERFAIPIGFKLWYVANMQHMHNRRSATTTLYRFQNTAVNPGVNQTAE